MSNDDRALGAPRRFTPRIVGGADIKTETEEPRRKRRGRRPGRFGPYNKDMPERAPPVLAKGPEEVGQPMTVEQYAELPLLVKEEITAYVRRAQERDLLELWDSIPQKDRATALRVLGALADTSS